MNYIGQLFWKKSTIGYGCLVLLGSVTIAGVAEVELNNQVLSKWIKKLGRNIKDSMASSSSSTQGEKVTASHVFYPFTYIGEEIGKVAVQAWPYVKGAGGAIVLLFKNIKEWWKQIKAFLLSFIKPEVYKELFKNLHLKIWRIIAFIVAGGEGRTQFFGLFGEKNKDSSLLGLKFLLGSSEKNKRFRAKPEVFTYLLARWFEEPARVTDKFERLTKTIKRVTDNIDKGSGSSGDSEEEDPNKVYELDIPTTRDYIDVEKGWNESLFNVIWTTEIMSKITTGTDYTGGTKTFLPIFRDWLKF